MPGTTLILRYLLTFSRKLAPFSRMILASILLPISGQAQAAEKSLAGAPTVFQMPAFSAQQHQLTLPIIALFRDRQFAKAESVLRQLTETYPTWSVHHYNLAAALARQGKSKAAIASLGQAIDLGFLNQDALSKDPDLDTLRGLPEFDALFDKLAEKARAKQASKPITPRLVENGRALVDKGNTIWEPRNNLLVSAFSFDNRSVSDQVHGGNNRISELLNSWHSKGEAAGNLGDLYDNRDNGHSQLSKKLFPQMSHIEYSSDARAAKVHYGPNSNLLFNAITIGNSSTALTGGPRWRSQARHVLTTPELVARAYQQYNNNHLYFYPEHRDHDTEHGDLFPANTPYMIVSQGSSSSDRPFLRAASAILAALKPQVKAYLRSKRLVMPTVQMIFRSNMATVRIAKDYLSARAHPSVFQSKHINLEKMIRAARDLVADEVPPQVILSVLQESRPQPGLDYFGPTKADEVLFNTPGAVARVVRSTAFERRMIVSAEKTTDPNGKPLKFTWSILRGEASKVHITPMSEDGSKVEIKVSWHERKLVPGQRKLTTNRVEIAVFADNGAHYSAPAFISLYYPPDQKRRYSPSGQLLEIDYASASLADRYVDPVLTVRRAWRDRYLYTAEGELIGWDRVSDGTVRQFTRHGALVLETDAIGRPTKAELIRYGLKAGPSGREAQEVRSGEFLSYTYKHESDLLGDTSHCATRECAGQ